MTSTLFSQIPPKREFRGAWIATVVNLDWPNINATPDVQKSNLINLLDDLHTIGINAVVFQVRPECDALFASPFEPWSYWVTGQQGRAPSPFYDPLEFAVEEAHKRGMELHAWFNPYRAERIIGFYPLASNHVAVLHPEWTFTSGSLRMLDPGNPQVRDYLTTVIADVVTRYDIDGVHFDDYFYPYSGMGNQDSASYANYNPQALLRADWRRNNVNTLIPFGIWKNGVPSGITGLDAYSVLYADAVAWLHDRSIDYLTPQLYWQIGGAQDYSKLMPWWADSVFANGRHFYPGQAPYRLIDSNWPANELPDQMNLNRANSKTLGSVFFRATHGLANNPKGFADSLKSNFYRYPALPPVMPWIDSLKPLAPENLRYEQIAGSGPAVLQWDSAPSAVDGDTSFSYVVYRLTSSVVQQSDVDDPSNIIAV
ncbi:MAG: family 10 glycosylhydrolase, partial [Ignavibacteriales bacterium]|nr:family 10 glycosylhydrolase [Ignavibacteriales bacterium]